jgi:hypothetical protein
LIRHTIADARGKTTKDELAIQTSLFWVVNSGAGRSGFSSTFLKFVAGRMKEDMEVSLWNELDKLLGGGGKGLMFEALEHMKLTQTDEKYTAKTLKERGRKSITMAFNLPKVLIRSVADIATVVEKHYAIPIFGNFMLVDSIVKPNIMLQFTVSLKHGSVADRDKWESIRANLGGSRKDDKLIFIIPACNIGKFSYTGVPDNLDCYYMTLEDVANETVLAGVKRGR